MCLFLLRSLLYIGLVDTTAMLTKKLYNSLSKTEPTSTQKEHNFINWGHEAPAIRRCTFAMTLTLQNHL